MSLADLQNKPYKERVRLLWTAVGVTAIIVIAIWAFALKYRDTGSTHSDTKFGQIIENLKTIKNYGGPEKK